MNLEDLKQKMPEIFETVKNDVRKIRGYDTHRAGLRLGLAEIGVSHGGFIGAMHLYPGTDIIMNTTPLNIMISANEEDNVIRAYIYHILLHEYLHSLRIVNEEDCRNETIYISKAIFKDENHPVLKLARNGIGEYIPNTYIIYLSRKQLLYNIPIEYLKDFDKESQTYFS